MTQAQTFHQFATAKAHSGRFNDIQDVKKHYSEQQYWSWFQITRSEYNDYLLENFPEMTLAQAAKLTAASETVECL